MFAIVIFFFCEHFIVLGKTQLCGYFHLFVHLKYLQGQIGPEFFCFYVSEPNFIAMDSVLNPSWPYATVDWLHSRCFDMSKEERH